MLKRLLCFALAVVLLAGFIPPVTVSAASNMTVSKDCVDLIKLMEGFTPIPKWDYGQWTVGFGCQCPDEDLERYLKEGIPVEEAEALLAEKLVYFDSEVNRFIDKHGLTLQQHQFDAIFSLTYNIGAAWLRKDSGNLINAIINGTTGNAFIYAMSAWCMAGGEFLPGLMRRRLVEADMYLNGNYALYAPDYYCYVRYDFNGGTGESIAQGFDSRLPAQPLVVPTYAGYVFKGWYTAPKGGTKVIALDETMNEVMLYAHWEVDSSGGQTPPAEDPPVLVTVTGDVVNVRSGPGTGYGIVNAVKQGTQLEITQVQDVDGVLWGKCYLGWLCLTYTNYDEVISGETETPPPPEEDPGEEEPDLMPVAPMWGKIIGTDSVTVYNGPHTGYPKLGTLARGERIQFLEFMDFMGSIWGRYEDGWVCINGYVLLEDDSVLYNTFFVTITNSWLNIRSGPGTEYSYLGALTYNDVVEILALKQVGSTTWGRIEKGWISLDYTNYDPSMIPEQIPPSPCPNGHTYESVITAPTCTEAGFTTHTCTVCGESYTDAETQPLGHSYVDEITAPTCTENGFTTHTCTVCGHSMVDSEVTASGHSYTDAVTAPTCTEGGYTTHICTVCGHSVVDNETAAKGHDYEQTALPPTCTDGGGTIYTCRTCGYSYTEIIEGTINHEYVATITDPTCTEEGFVTYTCTKCGHTHIADRIPALGHEDQAVVIAPTCTESGFTTHTCTACGDVYTDSYVEPLGHSYSPAVTAPTCTENGFTAYTCQACGESYVDNETQPLGHRYDALVTVPTCTEGGYTTHTCTACGYSYVDEKTDPTGHSYTAVTTAPTCTAEGYTTHTCTVCDHSYKSTPVAAIGHSYSAVVTPPTTQSQGYTTHTCGVCGHSYKDSYKDPIVVITKTYATITASCLTIRKGAGTGNAAVGYIYRGARVEILEKKNVSNKVWGRIDKGWICLTGYAALETVTEEVENPGTSTVKRTFATITASSLNIRSGPGTGYGRVGAYVRGNKVEILEQKDVSGKLWGKTDKGWICLTGYATLETVEEEVEHTHKYTASVTAPTCTAQGYTTHTCAACGHSYKDSATAALGHSYKSVVTAPTASAQGYTTHTCTRCGHSYKDSYTDPVPETGTVKRTFATITASSLNIRSGPGTGYGRVGAYVRGNKVEILEQKNVSGKLWGKTDKGWICLTGYATLETVTEEEEKPAKVIMTVTASVLNIRSGPGTNYNYVGSYTYGTKVEVLDTQVVSGTTWARTDKGWVSMKYLK